jgi:DHA1 family tetracycline resistance protein-like MFS transporter
MENGLSLFAVGVSSALVQGLLLGKLLKRFGAKRLALIGLASSTLSYFAFGAVTEGWMMYAVIICGLLGSTAAAAIQSLISGAADASSQGKTMGAVSSVNSMAAVLAPLIGAPLLSMVSEMPKGDWRLGAPFYFCAALQLCALLLAWTHFRKQRRARLDLPSASAHGDGATI